MKTDREKPVPLNYLFELAHGVSMDKLGITPNNFLVKAFEAKQRVIRLMAGNNETSITVSLRELGEIALNRYSLNKDLDGFTALTFNAWNPHQAILSKAGAPSVVVVEMDYYLAESLLLLVSDLYSKKVEKSH